MSIIETKLNGNIIMVDDLISRGKKLIDSQQNSVLSAASVIMIMVVLSRVLGLFRQRILANYFDPGSLSLFFAAFRLPDIIFEILVFGTFSSAFIPVFTKVLKTGEKHAWALAGRVVSVGLVIFIIVATFFGLAANHIYSVISPGFTDVETAQIATIARILFAAQGFFVVSYVLTGVLESLRRFLVPALAPIFYNLGIILGTIVLSPKMGLMGPAIGVVIGAFAHFLIQYPLSRKLGFRFNWGLKADDDLKKIGQLALPRVIDLSFDQVGKTVELFLASVISKASYTYFTFANTLQLLPVTLFGTSLAKAVLPILSSQADNKKEFRRILLTAMFQAIFFTLPVAAALIVLRVPVIRLIYGTKIFDWTATIQTGVVLSFFAVGVVSQTLMAILTRSFFALHDTKTPVIISFIGLGLLIAGDFILVKIFGFPVWALAASFTFSTLVEAIILLILINKRIGRILNGDFALRFIKIMVGVLASSSVMYFMLKIFDRSVWVKRLSFLSSLEATHDFPFQNFVLDTRYTGNLIVLTGATFLIGILIYLLVTFILQVPEVYYFLNLIKKAILKRQFPKIPAKEDEPIAPTTTDTQAQ
ncbi:MAG: murein biosynthesis integral membrane protein MurJ [Microgenomates group bacterium]